MLQSIRRRKINKQTDHKDKKLCFSDLERTELFVFMIFIFR